MPSALPAAVLRAPSRVFYGWWIAFAFMIASTYNAGVFVHGSGGLFKPIREEFGWSAAAISTALSLQRLEGGLAAPVVGNLIDRVGPRKLFFAGIVISTLGFVLISQAQNLWMFYLGFIVAATGNSSQAPTIGLATVNHWFNRNRGKAMAVVIAGGGLGGIMVPLIIFLIDQLGWRHGLLITAAGFWGFGLPFLLIARRRPEDMGLEMDGGPPKPVAADREKQSKRKRPVAEPAADFTFREAVRTRSFWLLGISFALVQLTISSVLVHVIPALEDAGISRQTAAWAVTGFTLVSVIGRVSFGWLSDTFDKRWLMVVALVTQVGGVLLLAVVQNIGTLVAFVIVYGIGFGGGLPIRPALQTEYFGRKNFGTIQGAFISLTSFSAMAAPIVAGAVRDATDHYDRAFIVLAIASALAVPMFLLARRPGKPVRPALATAGVESTSR